MRRGNRGLCPPTAVCQVMRVPIKDRQTPLLTEVLIFCENAAHYLFLDDTNMLVLHCNSRRDRSAVFASVFLLYSGHSVATHRQPPMPSTSLQPAAAALERQTWSSSRQCAVRCSHVCCTMCVCCTIYRSHVCCTMYPLWLTAQTAFLLWSVCSAESNSRV